MIAQIPNQILLAAISVTIAILTAVIPFFWRVVQSRRFRLEEAIHRESHNLKLFEALASKNHLLQLAAAAVLAERLTAGKNAEAEHRIIIRALLAVTKDPVVPQEVAKFVADHVVRNHQIPLKEFDWQNTRLSRAWWRGINASEADFWRADLSSAGMRNAVLRKSVFFEARLDGSVLRGADLTEADLRKASMVDTDLQETVLDRSVLCGANLTGAKLDKASLLGTDLQDTILDRVSFAGAVYNQHTKFPSNFDPQALGLINKQVPATQKV
jgi:hypothetical protein